MTHVHHDLVHGAGTLDDAIGWLRQADRVLFSAGAGLSAAAGYDYADSARFHELFPALAKHGFSARYQLIGQPLPDRLLWGFWAVHVTDIRLGSEPNALYQSLRSLVAERPYAVMTSNVDMLFARNGFTTNAFYTPQGDYALYQCLTPCTRKVWDARPVIEKVLADYDATTGMTSLDAVPACPNCGGKVHLNVYAGAWYINDHFQPGLEAVNEFLRDTAAREESLAILEIGAGFNTPGVVRWPDEQLARNLPNTRLIRINPDHPGVPADLGRVSASLTIGASEFIAAALA